MTPLSPEKERGWGAEENVSPVAEQETHRQAQKLGEGRASRLAPRAFLLLLLLFLPCFSLAHPANIPAARMKVSPDGKVQLRIRLDLLAFVVDATPTDVADGPMNELLDGPPSELQSRLTEAQNRFKARMRLAGGTIDTVTFPTAAEVTRWVDSNGSPRLPVMMSIDATGHLPKGASTVSLKLPDVLGSVVVTTELPYREPFSEPVDPGNASTPQPIPTAAQIHDAQVAFAEPRGTAAPEAVKPVKPKASEKAKPAAPKPTVRAEPDRLKTLGILPDKEKPAPEKPATKALPKAEEAKPSDASVASSKREGLRALPKPTPPVSAPPLAASTPQTASVPPTLAASPSPLSWATTFPRYVRMGFTHILPEGLDHILFVLGLFLLSKRWKDLLKQITAFTVAHSLTLALSLYGVVRLPSSIVEPVIAASIAFVALENLFTQDVKSWRLYVVFAFGLVHGLGFASALRETGLAKGDFLTGLVGFNLGVELGQITVVAMAFLAVGWFRANQHYRSWVTVPGSVGIAAIALFWTVQRIMGGA